MLQRLYGASIFLFYYQTFVWMHALLLLEYSDLVHEQQFPCDYRGKISAKGKGAIDMYFVKN